jgi:hypothetical protein
MTVIVEERWMPVTGFPGYYVSDLGRICSTLSGRILKPGRQRDDYLQVVMQRDRRGYTRLLSRIVCEAFHGPPPGERHAAHKDGDINNNTAANLVWATPSENNAHKIAHGTIVRGSKAWASKLTEREVLSIVSDRGLSLRRAAKAYGVSRRTIQEIRLGRTWSWLTGISQERGRVVQQTPASDK